jgi:type VI protein secretion system component VasK
MPFMNLAELGLLLAALVLPLILGMVAALMKKPWWWAAIAAIVVAMVATIAPTPEPGEARLVPGDIPFLLIVTAVVAGLVWLGWFLTRRFRRRSEIRRRPGAKADQDHLKRHLNMN